MHGTIGRVRVTRKHFFQNQLGRENVSAILLAISVHKAMALDGWKQRLRAAIEASGKSGRAISIAAGVNERFLAQLFTEGKEPRIGKFMQICEALNVSPGYILTGVDIDPDGERLLRLWSQASPEQREAFLVLLRAQRLQRTEPEA
jgi:transcriptional regulator with XRE-family HTH domain